jgi:hypothetical protein
MVQCVICKDIKLEKIDVNVLKCPSCKNKYVLGYEILKHEDEITNPYEEDPDIELSGLDHDSPELLVRDNEFYDDNEDSDSYNNGDISIPKYMKSSATLSVVEYREE